VWSNPQMEQFAAADEDPGLAITLFDLVKAFGELLERAKNRPVYEVAEEEVSVGQMIAHLRSLFVEAGENEPVYIMRVFEAQRSRRAMIALSTIHAMISGMLACTRVATSDPPSAAISSPGCRQQ